MTRGATGSESSNDVPLYREPPRVNVCYYNFFYVDAGWTWSKMTRRKKTRHASPSMERFFFFRQRYRRVIHLSGIVMIQALS
jgi:hypothetical protein